MRPTGLVLLVVSFFGGWWLLGQPSPTYEQEYAWYQKASAETDPAQRRALLLEFVRKWEKSELDAHIAALYAPFYEELRRRGEWRQLATTAEEFLRHRPADVVSIAAATEAYQKLNSPQKLVEFGARLYAQNPNVATAYFVAKAYQSMNDKASFVKWAEKTLQHDPNNLEMLVESITSYWGGQNLTKAAALATRTLKALDVVSAPAGLSAADWKVKSDQIRAYCYRALGEEAWVRNAFPESQKHFQAAVKLDPKNDMAQYRLGFLYWRAGDVDAGLGAFAKAVVLSGPTSSDARKQLHDLYTQRYRNPAGITRLLQGAKAELGIQ